MSSQTQSPSQTDPPWPQHVDSHAHESSTNNSTAPRNMESAKPYAPVLPAELMIQIFLDPVLDLYDVLRCAGVNRFWYQIAYQQNPVRRKLFLPLLDKSRNGIPTLRLAKGEPPNTIRRHARAYPQATLVVGPNPDTPQSAPWYLFLHPVIGQNRYSTRPDRSTEPPYFIGYQYENRAPIYAKLCRYHPPSSSSGPGQESWRKMCVTWPPVNKVKVKVDHGHLMCKFLTIKNPHGVTLEQFFQIEQLFHQRDAD